MFDSLPFAFWPRETPLLTVLIYHRVLPMPEPLRAGEVDAVAFEAQMEFMRRHFEMLPLADAATRLRSGRLPRRACCVTFDDGYADNLTIAQPILERYGIPATVFVATAYLDGGRMFNDTVIEVIAKCEQPEIDLSELGLVRLRLATIDDRRSAIRTIQVHLKYMAPEVRSRAIDTLIRISGCTSLPDDLMLSTPQLETLSKRGVDIGGHTDVHAILTTLDREAAVHEIGEGRRKLEAIVAKPVRCFAYPNGWPDRDYQSMHVSLVRELGFECAVTTAPGVAGSSADPFQLPRFVPWGRPDARFAVRLVRNARLAKPALVC